MVLVANDVDLSRQDGPSIELPNACKDIVGVSEGQYCLKARQILENLDEQFGW